MGEANADEHPGRKVEERQARVNDRQCQQDATQSRRTDEKQPEEHSEQNEIPKGNEEGVGQAQSEIALVHLALLSQHLLQLRELGTRHLLAAEERSDGFTGGLVAGFLGLAFADKAWMAFVALPVCVLGFAMIGPSLASLLSRRTSRGTQGEILGVLQSGLSLARIIGPLAGLALFGLSHRLPYLIAAAIMTAAFLGALALKRAPVPEAADN